MILHRWQNTFKKGELNSRRLSSVSGGKHDPLKTVVIKIGIFTVRSKNS
jgi:hypothetical protein